MASILLPCGHRYRMPPPSDAFRHVRCWFPFLLLADGFGFRCRTCSQWFPMEN